MQYYVNIYKYKFNRVHKKVPPGAVTILNTSPIIIINITVVV